MGSNPTLSANAPVEVVLLATAVAARVQDLRRDDRVAEGARLESVCTGNRTEGSNPSLSAKPQAVGVQFGMSGDAEIGARQGRRCEEAWRPWGA